MKKLLLVLTALMITATSFAQTSLLATLSHDGTITTYYGSTALKEAMAQAADGDAITLSAGQFLAANLNKNVIIRGAGMSIRSDSVYSHESTLINGDFEISSTDSASTHRLNVEGVYFTSKMTYKGAVTNALFTKCRFGSIAANNGTLVNGSFIHCRIADGFTLTNNSSAGLINCLVWNPYNRSTTASNFEFDNCVVWFPEYRSTSSVLAASNVINSYYKNCMIMVNDYAGSRYTTEVIPSSCTAVNCVGCSDYGSLSSINNDIFYYMWSRYTTNKNVAKPSSVFKSGGFDYNDSEQFELTDEAKTAYKGTDGTEIGIHGGSLPYEEDPSTPQITKCNVAAKSTADGKLSVDIEVKAAE